VAPSADDPEPEKETPQQEDDKDERKIPVLQEIPDLLLPKRSLRGTTAPPRPKSVHSMIGSDGSFTPTGSVCGDSLDGDSFIRNPSDASTVKPLQFKKAGKPQIVEIPQPPGPKDKVERKDDDEIEDWYNPDVSVSLKRKYTKHADLISILSVPKSNKSLRSAARSRRSKGRKHVETLTVEDLLKEFSTEEVKYLRELRTLVEDVVPILFQTVLGRADDDLRRTSSISSIGTAGTFATASSRSSRGFSSNPTRPIVDMGISLERLRTLHERIPTGNVDQILTWAGDAKRVYEEYLSVWRMGFQDVVVTMTPDEDDYDRKDANIRKELEILHGTLQGGAKNPKYEGDPSTWALPPPPNMEEVKDEKVDVAFLLKRPLVRLKLLAKLFKVSWFFLFGNSGCCGIPFFYTLVLFRFCCCVT
jgi:hypothetical protein